MQRSHRIVTAARWKTGAPISSRRGLTLFEVMLALAIFAISLAAIGQMMSSGVRGAVQARLQSQAVLRCQSRLAEVTGGVLPFQNVNKMAFADDPAWLWSLTVTPATQTNLYTLELTVEHPSQDVSGEVSFTLRRMARDPQIATAALLEQQAQAASSTNSSTSGSSTSGSASSGSGSSGSGSGASRSSGSGSSGSGSSGSGSSGSGSSGSRSSGGGSSSGPSSSNPSGSSKGGGSRGGGS